MFRVHVHKRIQQITEVFYRVGLWHRENEETVADRRLKIFYSIYYCLYPFSLMAGALTSDNQDEKIFLVQMSIMSAVLLVKLLHIIWRKGKILEQLDRVCDYSVGDRDTFTKVNGQSNFLMKFVTVFLISCYVCAICISLVLPFLGAEKQLFFNIGFPFNYKNNEFAYVAACIFIFSQLIITVISITFSAIVWYLLANCGLRYVALGQQIKVIGERKDVDEAVIEMKISKAQRDNLYQRDLIEAITKHQDLEELTKRLGSFLYNVFVVQLTTSGLCICASVYCLAFSPGNNLIENIIFLIFLMYNIFDIFMVMFFGNEIQAASDNLSYNLFESNWVDRSQSIKTDVFIFGESLKKSNKLVVLKLYPLTLETFMRILKSAYSMFNIMKNFK